jgi:hypothetical protein
MNSAKWMPNDYVVENKLFALVLAKKIVRF